MRPDHLPPVLRAARSPMHGFAAPWCVAGGWALDLFLGRLTREHADLELAIFRDDQSQLQSHLERWTLQTVVGGQRVSWSTGQRLSLPVHEIHACSIDQPHHELEFLLNERTATEWVFRSNGEIRLPLEKWIVQSESGFPVLCPAIVLLFKAKARRAKDEADFRSARDAMGAARGKWLRDAQHVCYPHHDWLSALDS